jgi:hypothetical protein
MEFAKVAGGNNDDWRADCVKPPKDTRIQTAVSNIIITYMYVYSFAYTKFIILGCDCH